MQHSQTVTIPNNLTLQQCLKRPKWIELDPKIKQSKNRRYRASKEDKQKKENKKQQNEHKHEKQMQPVPMHKHHSSDELYHLHIHKHRHVDDQPFIHIHGHSHNHPHFHPHSHCHQHSHDEQQPHFHEQHPNLHEQLPILKLIQSHFPIANFQYYQPQFVRIFILVKVNSLAKHTCGVNLDIVQLLIKLYNQTSNSTNSKLSNIILSTNQSQIFSQILNLLLPYLDQNALSATLPITHQQLCDILQGTALLATSSIWLYHQTSIFLSKAQYAFVLSFVALGGREMAFVPIVHQEKYHPGQIYFAARVREIFYVQGKGGRGKKKGKQEIKVQDPYSMRCAPQVYGIAYDCFWQLKQKLPQIINNAHHLHIRLGLNKYVPNIAMQSDTFSQKCNFLQCCIQQIAATSFLRAQRILNTYLCPSNLPCRPEHTPLLNMLKSCFRHTSQLKLQSCLSNFDTCCVGDYQQDVYYNVGSLYHKTSTIIKGAYAIMAVQIMSAIEALRDLHWHDTTEQGEKVEEFKFTNEQMNSVYIWLKSRLSVWDRNTSLHIVANSHWRQNK